MIIYHTTRLFKAWLPSKTCCYLLVLLQAFLLRQFCVESSDKDGVLLSRRVGYFASISATQCSVYVYLSTYFLHCFKDDTFKSAW